jgi:diguanylate cyclase (GGDEF)-like protein/PAS domain S-box-containing protein
MNDILRPPRILIADDDPATRMLVSEVLQGEGMEVLAVEDGLCALDAFHRFAPDLVLADVHMPGLDGYELCARLRGFRIDEAFPIIIMTAEDDEQAVAQAFAAGATYFLMKPISWTLLAHRIQYFLRAADAARKLRESLHRAQVLFETAVEGILVVDVERRTFRDANPALCRMLGHSRPSLLNLKLCDLLWGSSQENCHALIDRCAHEQQGRIEDILVRRADGECIHADITYNGFSIDGQRCVACFFTDVTEKRLEEERLMQRATHDALTGLPNRALLFERLTQAVKQSHRRGLKAALLFVDLDRFKPVNDLYGHAVGDSLLVEVAQRLQGLVRDEDTVARLGGDEFIVLMPMLEGDALSAASMMAERIIAKLSRPVEVGLAMVGIGASVGIALYPEHADSAAALLDAADKAMYRAKHAGRARHAAWIPEGTNT